MLKPADSYETLTREFVWAVPERYNMAAAVCDRWAREVPERVAVTEVAGPCDVTFGRLRAMADALAWALRRRGVRRGDRVGVLRSQSAWTAAAHIAVWKLGAISMPLFVLFREAALLTRLADSGACFVITEPQSEAQIAPLCERLPQRLAFASPEAMALDDRAPFEAADTAATDPALLIYTSGTTGPPKGALLPQQTLLGHLPGVDLSHDFLGRPGDCLWTPADWAWIGGLLDVLMPGLHHGVRVVAQRLAKFDSARAKAVMEMHGVRNVFLPPTALKVLRADGVQVGGLRSVASGGEPLGIELIHWGRTALGVTINEFYGQTECNMVVSGCSALFQPRPGCIGRAAPGHEVAVIDAAGQPTSGEGDIAVRRGTPVMMLGYWNQPAATARKFRGDWLVTGDHGMMEQGYVRFIARDDDVITSSGYRIGPAAIEDCLLGHPAVALVGVVGKPDDLRTEIVKAYIRLNAGYVPGDALVAELQAYVRERLAVHEYPREIGFIDEFPLTVTGKIIRRELKARAVAERSADH